MLVKESTDGEIELSNIEPAPTSSDSSSTSNSSTSASSKIDKELSDLKEKLLNEYKDVFPDQLPSGLPPHRDIEHEIKTHPNSIPPFEPHRKMNVNDLNELKEHLKEMIELGHITPSNSPYGSPVLFVKKKDEVKRRLCIDYRALNNQTIKNKYPLPRVSELLERLSGVKYVSKLDFRSGYHQIQVKEEDRPKTTFTTRYGNYMFNVLPFGLCNAPSTFMYLINTVLAPYTDEFVIAYLDDLLIYSKTLEEHYQHLKLVLDRLRENKLFCKLSKCVFFQSNVPFLGFIVGRDGIQVDPAKVEAVKNWKTPTSLTETRSFLGFAGFYRRFIANFSAIAAPITALTKTANGIKFKWNDEAEKAFNKLKEMLIKAPVLIVADPSLPYVLQTDCSGFAIGAVLQQDHGNGLQPISFFSQKLGKHELNYPVHHKEMFAIIQALKEYEYLLKGTQFEIRVQTDHKSLIHFNKQKSLTAKQLRWANYLADFGELKIEYIKGKQNHLADALSRRPHDNDNLPTLPSPITPIDITPSSSSSGIHPIGELLVISSITSSLRSTIIKEYQKDPITKQLLLSPPPSITIKNNLIYKKNRIIIPNNIKLQQSIISMNHDNKLSGHLGVKKTTDLIQRNYTWSGITNHINDYIKSCVICQTTKASTKAPLGKLSPLPIPPHRFHTYSMDFIGPFPPSGPLNHNQILVVVEKLTKLVFLIPTFTTATSSDTAALFFSNIIAKGFGFPQVIISDRDSKFTSNFWQSLWSLCDVRFNMSTSFRPQTDGQSEEMNKIIKNMIRTIIDKNQQNWYDHLPFISFAINNSINSTTKQTPFFLTYGQHPHLPSIIEQSSIPPLPGNASIEIILKQLHDDIEVVKNNIKHAQSEQSKYYNPHHQHHQFHINDRVLLDTSNITIDKTGTSKLNDKYAGPFKIIKVVSPHSYTLQLPSHWYRLHPTFHISKLRPFFSSSIFPREQQDRPEPELSPTGEPVWEVEKITDKRTIRKGKKVIVELKVKWKHYDETESTWEPILSLRKQVPQLVKDYMQTH